MSPKMELGSNIYGHLLSEVTPSLQILAGRSARVVLEKGAREADEVINARIQPHMLKFRSSRGSRRSGQGGETPKMAEASRKMGATKPAPLTGARSRSASSAPSGPAATGRSRSPD